MTNKQEVEDMMEDAKGLQKVVQNPIAPKIFKENALKFYNSLNAFFKKPSSVPITQFCEENLWLPKEVTAEEGLYRCDRTPYLRDIMNLMHPSNPCNKVVFWSGTQLGKTQGLFNVIFYYMVNDPCGIVFGFSNDKEKNKMVTSRLDPIIKENKWLSDLIVKTRRSSGSTLNLKVFKGGFMSIASAQTPASFRSMPARIILLDEIDAYPIDASGEGDIISLATKRTSTYGNRYKIYLSSTTTNKASKIMAEYKNTDMRKYYVPCPHCGKMQLFDWDRFDWRGEGTRVDEVWMSCEECGYHIHEHEKIEMLPKGKWIATNPEPTALNTAGFWINGLYAPYGWQSWEKCMTEYLDAVNSDSEAKKSVFFNCILAEPYQVETTVPDWKNLYNKSKGSDYIAGEVPNDVVFLTSGSDVQDDRIESEVVGWTRLGRCVSIETFKFYCDQGSNTENIEDSSYANYQKEVLEGTWRRKDGIEMKTVINALDRNYHTPQVNAFWARYNKPNHLILVRGDDNAKEHISQMRETRPGKNNRGKKKKSVFIEDNDRAIEYGKYRYITVGVSLIKSELYKTLMIEDNPERNVHGINVFPNDYDEEYFRQLTAEVPELNKNTGKKKWRNTNHTRNEVLDMHVYNYAMWYKLGAYNFKKEDYDDLEARYNKKVSQVKERTRRVRKSKRRILNAGGVY